MLDVETSFSDVEDFQDKGEERDAAEHHCGDIAAKRVEEQFPLAPIFADLFPGLLFNPLAEGGLLFSLRSNLEMEGRLLSRLRRWDYGWDGRERRLVAWGSGRVRIRGRRNGRHPWHVRIGNLRDARHDRGHLYPLCGSDPFA